MPLNEAFLSVASIWLDSADISVWIASRSFGPYVSDRDWMVSSRRRWRMLVVSARKPSAVWTIEMPSIVLRTPWAMPMICAVIELPMAIPAASSLAEVIRWPLDSRAMTSLIEVLARCDAANARSAAPLVLMTVIALRIPNSHAPCA